jgi:hypothetical protein
MILSAKTYLGERYAECLCPDLCVSRWSLRIGQHLLLYVIPLPSCSSGAYLSDCGSLSIHRVDSLVMSGRGCSRSLPIGQHLPL